LDNLTLKAAISPDNLSFLLVNFLDSSYKKDLKFSAASLSLASYSSSAFLLLVSLANNLAKIVFNYPLMLANDLTVF